MRHERNGYQFSLTGTAVNGVNGFRYVWGDREIRPGAEFGRQRPVPGFGRILRATDEGRSWYRALLLQASRPLTERRSPPVELRIGLLPAFELHAEAVQHH